MDNPNALDKAIEDHLNMFIEGIREEYVRRHGGTPDELVLKAVATKYFKRGCEKMAEDCEAEFIKGGK